MISDHDPDQAEFWRVETSHYDTAAFALIVGGAIGFMSLTVWFVGAILGVW
jgi:hypothetical protein